MKTRLIDTTSKRDVNKFVDLPYKLYKGHPYYVPMLKAGQRKLLELVREGHVTGWDDARMPTLKGMRRRGYTPEAIRNFADAIGVALGQIVNFFYTLQGEAAGAQAHDVPRSDVESGHQSLQHPVEAVDLG